jgi:hypothetical protein
MSEATSPSDADYSGRWRRIKGQFGNALVKAHVPLSRGRNASWRLAAAVLGAYDP